MLFLSQLREKDDEQCFHVVAVNAQGDRSRPSDTISFFKSELFSQLSYFFTAGPSPPPSDTESDHATDNLPEEIKSRVLVKIISPCNPTSDTTFKIGQILAAELDSEGYRVSVDSKSVHVSPASVVTVPITRRVVALYDYHPSAMSPNTDSHVEISFMAGDVILIHGQDAEGFLQVLHIFLYRHTLKVYTYLPRSVL